jgi:hypothetical protein
MPATRREVPAAGEEVQLPATVCASGDTFTHVPVEFWDGEPAAGGRLIGERVIPMILVGQSSTASFGWDTSGLRGRRDIWIVIQQHPDKKTALDNQTYRALDLEPNQLYCRRCGRTRFDRKNLIRPEFDIDRKI